MNLESLPLVLADIGDVIGSIVGIIFLIVWVIGQLTGAKKEEKPPQLRQQAARHPEAQQPPAGQQAGPRGAQAAAAAGADPLRDDPLRNDPLRNQVEEFLRRAGRQPKPDAAGPAPGQGGRAARRPPAPPREEIEILLEEVPAERQRQPLSERLRPDDRPAAKAPRPAPAAAKKRPLSQHGAQPRRETLAEHAEQIDASARSKAERSPKLGQGLVQADEQFDVRLSARLDHKMSTMDERHAQRMHDDRPVEAVATPASQIAAMLTNPAGVRQAIILNEILRRPADRWE